MNGVRFTASASILTWTLLGACAQPPTKELSLIEDRVQGAREAEAALFAPEILAEAEAALSQAESLATERRHRDAIRAAGKAALHADEAAQRASATRALFARDVTRLMAEIEGLLAMSASRGARDVEDAAKQHILFAERYQQILALSADGNLLETMEAASALKPELIEFEKRFR